VADYHHNEVRAFNVTNIGSASASWATTAAITLGDGKPNGHAEGQLNAPYNVGFSPNGTTVYVADTGNERVQVWNCCQAPMTQPAQWYIGSRCTSACPAVFPNATPDLQFQQLRRVTIDPSGNLWIADFWGSGVHEISPSGTAGIEIDGWNSSLPGFEEAYGVAVSGTGASYVVDRLDQRVEEFDSSGNYVTTVGKRGVAVGAFSWPESDAVSPTDGSLWVADTRNDRLEQWPSTGIEGKPNAVVGTSARGTTPAPGYFNYIEGVSVGPDGTVWIADTNDNSIQSYTYSASNPGGGTFKTYGITRGNGNCQLINPEGVAAVSDNNVYVADTANNRVEEMQLSGGTCTFLHEYDGLDAPQGITVAPDGTVWVANTGTGSNDGNGNDIVQLSADLSKQLSSFGGPGTGSYQFDQPHSLAFSADGSTLFVADTYNDRVQEFAVS
jgi:sugar lactone lactonase YvrE